MLAEPSTMFVGHTARCGTLGTPAIFAVACGLPAAGRLPTDRSNDHLSNQAATGARRTVSPSTDAVSDSAHQTGVCDAQRLERPKLDTPERVNHEPNDRRRSIGGRNRMGRRGGIRNELGSRLNLRRLKYLERCGACNECGLHRVLRHRHRSDRHASNENCQLSFHTILPGIGTRNRDRR
jgi:hypothetical protein